MNVKIIRVLNTNAVVSVDSQGRELIMTGPGIGFKKRKGENIDQSLVDKTYHLENKEESKRLQEGYDHRSGDRCSDTDGSAEFQRTVL